LAIAATPFYQSRSRRCTNSAWITHRSMKLIVKAHQGSNGMMPLEVSGERVPAMFRGFLSP
jgi:hypothetical protein